MKKILETPLGKLVLEALRWGVLALVATAVQQLLTTLPTLEQTPSTETLLIVLRVTDALLHKTGVAEKGIVRF